MDEEILFFLEDICNVSSYSLYYRFNYSRTKFGITFVFFTISKAPAMFPAGLSQSHFQRKWL
ncbi:hypothetical protein CSC18_0773 [Klebsiella aerogenes]|nr:hypothetical protein CSC18_0773 [Klebsiella aerogenes]